MDMALSSISRRTRVNISLVFHCFRVFTFSGTHLTPIRNIRVVCFPVGAAARGRLWGGRAPGGGVGGGLVLVVGVRWV